MYINVLIGVDPISIGKNLNHEEYVIRTTSYDESRAYNNHSVCSRYHC